MIQQFLAQRDLISWPLGALVLFFATFVAVLLYVIVGLRGRPEKIEHAAALPLEGGERVLGKESYDERA